MLPAWLKLGNGSLMKRGRCRRGQKWLRRTPRRQMTWRRDAAEDGGGRRQLVSGFSDVATGEERGSRLGKGGAVRLEGEDGWHATRSVWPRRLLRSHPGHRSHASVVTAPYSRTAPVRSGLGGETSSGERHCQTSRQQ